MPLHLSEQSDKSIGHDDLFLGEKLARKVYYSSSLEELDKYKELHTQWMRNMLEKIKNF